MQVISVIVPIYKVEKFLNKCIESLVNQSYENLEIILVDDGSPDSCPLICDDWASQDPRIVVIHKENGGLSDARNKGLDVATGEYISFVDSDDWLASDFYEVLIKAIQNEQAQIAASSITWVYDDRIEKDPRQYSQKVYTTEDAMGTLIQGNCFYAVAWNKLYHISLFEGIRFPVGKLHEDEFVTYKVMGCAEKLILCTETEYFYRQRSGSIMQEWSLKHLDALDAFFERNNYLKIKFPRLYLRDKITFFNACVCFYRECGRLPNSTQGKKKILSYARRIHFSVGELLQLKPKALVRLFKGRMYLEVEGKYFGKD